MMTRCLACGARTRHATHWLCQIHRNERGKNVPRAASEYELMRALVFDFPETARYDEFRARVMYVVETWGSPTRVADVASAHGVRAAAERTVRPREERALICSLVEYVCKHVHFAPASLSEACAGRVREWYPALACADTLGEMIEGERMLYALERATGRRDFLVVSDTILALSPVLSRDAIVAVHAEYVRALRE